MKLDWTVTEEVKQSSQNKARCDRQANMGLDRVVGDKARRDGQSDIKL